MAGNKINVGVIGYGMSAKVFHIPLVLTTPQFNLHAIVQRSPSAQNSAPNDHPTAKHYTTTDALLADDQVDLIVITTTPDSHFALCKSALEAGKHVLVEKPFVPTSAEATQLISISKASKKLICVYQNRRWDTDFLTFQKLRADGTLGRIVEFETHFDRYKAERPTNWKGELGMDQAGGVIYDLGTHLLDQAVVAFGVPETVTGFFNVERDDPKAGEEPDSFTAILRYGPGGPVVTAKAGVMCVESEQLRYWVRGSKGSWRKCHLDCQEDQLKAGSKPGDDGFGIEDESKSGTLTVLEGGKPKSQTFGNIVPLTYRALYEKFAHAVEKNDESLVPVKASEARDVLRIIEAVRESAKTGKSVVVRTQE